MAIKDIDDLHLLLTRRLAQPGYKPSYQTESDFEADVWTRVWQMFKGEAATVCLTSHKNRAGRSAEAWQRFCSANPGPDVEILGSRNRLDIVVLHPVCSIGIEIKCLGNTGHAGKFTQGLGQAVLALANRDRTIFAIHCGTVGSKERDELRRVAKKISHGTRAAIVVAP